ncbi:MAG: Uma2 family endonuclease [Candidatus Kapaibacteriota bacterium]|jgi:Uma2 family endonuclease
MEGLLDTEEEIAHEITDYERERGKPMPSFNHSETQLNVIAQVLQFPDFKPYPELDLELGGERSVPDVAVFRKQTASTLKGIIRVTVPPLFTIEILSPGQGLTSLFDKAALYLQNGVEEAWILIPEIQSITVCKPGGLQKTFVEGSVTHESTGITVDITKTFR